MVFVIDNKKNPLSPTAFAKARLLLKQKRAVVHRAYPFVIRLKKTSECSNKYTIKIDPGSTATGMAIVNSNKCLFLVEIIHRGKAIKKALTDRRGVRRSRRNRKTRYRECRFLNRRRDSGWLAPSVKSRADNIINITHKFAKYIPVDSLVIERVSFDTSSMTENRKLYGNEYQVGDLKGVKLRRFIFNKYDSSCVYCGNSDNLEIEHIKSISKGGTDSVKNLTLSCRECNVLKSNLSLKEFGKLINKDLSYLNPANTPKEAAIIQSARNYTINELAKSFEVSTAEGWETSFNRKEINLPKEHYYDALCVGDSYNYKIVANQVLVIKAQGRGSRQMCRVDRFGFPRTSAKANKQVYGFQTGDIVKAVVPKGKKQGKYLGKVSVRSSGSFNIATNTQTVQGIGYKHCTLAQKTDGYAYYMKGANRFLTDINDSVSSVRVG